MEYAELVAVYRRLEMTSSTAEKRDVLAETFAGTDAKRLPLLVVLLQGRVFAAWDPRELGVSSSLGKRAIAKATGVPETRVEDRWRETGDLGDAAAWAIENRTQRTLVSTDLDVTTVHDTLRELATYDGEGSQERRIDAIARLLNNADPDEARYVVRTVLGHLRIGIGDGTVRDAIARAFLDGSEGAIEAVERAFQVTTDYRLVAETARDEGREGLSELGIELFRPVRVMLAEKAEGLEAGLEAIAADDEAVLLEQKYDGARIQLHKRGEEVRVFTRRLEDVTEAFPDAVRAVREGVDAETCVLDGEAVGYDPETGEPVAFQRFSRRIKRKYDVETVAEEIPVTVYLFDCLSLEGESLLDRSLRDRLDRLESVLEPRKRAIERATHCRPTDLRDARAFYEEALAAGHEGIVLKNLDAAYQPGRRVGYLMKVKPAMETLDLVVTRGQHSEGRRSEFLGRLFLACVDDAGAFLEVGRLATGYTDEELRELTERLEALIVERNGRLVEFRPEVVLEVEFEEVQASSKYGSGYALRFPRFVGVRDDLDPTGADTLARVETLYEQQYR